MTPIQPPMTDERLDRLVRQLLTERADDVAATAMPALTMAAAVASHVRRGGVADRRPLLLVAAALLLVLAAGAVAVGSGLVRPAPPAEPTPIPAIVPPLNDSSPTPARAAVPGRVFYTVQEGLRIGDEGGTDANAGRFGTCTRSRIWAADADGTNASELFPESTDRRTLVDVSDAGDAVLFTGLTQINGQSINGTYLAELGPAGQVLSTRLVSHELLDDGCVGLCAEDTWFTFSPDGSRLAYVHLSRKGDEDFGTAIAIQEVATGQIVELDATRTTSGNGYDGAARWSPDGTRILFAQESKGIATSEDPLLDTATFIVDADGANLRQLTANELSGHQGAWAPDGTQIAFTSSVPWLGVDAHGKRENFNEDSDVYTIRPDGSDLRRLTNFAPKRKDRGVPVQQGGHVTGWTHDGRIVFTLLRWAGEEGDSTNLPPQLWVMDADGANATQVNGSDIAALTALGCVDCPYPPGSDGLEFGAFWRPAR